MFMGGAVAFYKHQWFEAIVLAPIAFMVEFGVLVVYFRVQQH